MPATYPTSLEAVLTSPLMWISAILFIVFVTSLIILAFYVIPNVRVADKYVALLCLSFIGSLFTVSLLLGGLTGEPAGATRLVITEATAIKYGTVVVDGINGNDPQSSPISGRTATTTFDNCWINLNDKPQNITVMCGVGEQTPLVELNELTEKQNELTN